MKNPKDQLMNESIVMIKFFEETLEKTLEKSLQDSNHESPNKN